MKMREREGLNHKPTHQDGNYDCNRNSPCDDRIICVTCNYKRRKRKSKEWEVQVHKLYEILTALKPAVSQGIEWDEFIVLL